MTPREYIRQIERLVASGDHRRALAFSTRHRGAVAQHLTDTELLHVGGLLEGAAMAIDLAEGDVAAGTHGATEPTGAAKRRGTAATT